MSKQNFDPNDLKKNIFNSAIQHPLTMFPTGLAFLGGLGFALFDLTALSGLAVGGLVVGAGSYCYNYFNRKTYFTEKYVKELQAKMKKEREAIISNVTSRLGKMSQTSSGVVRDHADQCLSQLTMSQRQLVDFTELLNEKLVPGELTYSKFLVSVEQTYLALLDNLNKAVQIFAGIQSIDTKYIATKLSVIEKQSVVDEHDEEEKKSLLKRRKLYDEAVTDINAIITENEKALTAMNELMLSISKVQMMKGQSDEIELKDAYNNLEEIARHTSDYSVK